MKIAQVTPYDMSQPGGVSEHIGHLHEEFNRLGHEVTVLAPRSKKGGLEVGQNFYGVGRTVSIPGNGSKVRLTLPSPGSRVNPSLNAERGRFRAAKVHALLSSLRYLA